MHLNTTPNKISQGTTTINSLLSKIESTCDALINALEISTESASQYGGGILHQFDTEYVDHIIRTLLQLKYYTIRLASESQKGLIKNKNDMQIVIEGMYELTEKLDQLMIRNGFIKNHFEYGINEIKSAVEAIL